MALILVRHPFPTWLSVTRRAGKVGFMFPNGAVTADVILQVARPHSFIHSLANLALTFMLLASHQRGAYSVLSHSISC
jgi:hypothetical protein